jgi:hypothetical protein
MTAGTALPFASAPEHMAAELGWLALVLDAHVETFRSARATPTDGFQGLFVGDEQVNASLGGVLLGLPGRPLGEPARATIAAARRALDERVEATVRHGGTAPLAALAHATGLDEFERTSLLLAAAAEIEPRFELAFAYLQDDVTRRRPTAGLALDLLGGGILERLARRAALGQGGRLASARLVAVDEREPFPAAPLRVDARVIEHVIGAPPRPDARVRGFVQVRPADTTIALLPVDAATRAQLERIAARWSADPGFAPLALLGGRASVGADGAAAVAGELGRPVVSVDLAGRAPVAAPPDDAAALVRREGVLSGGVVVLTGVETLADRGEEGWAELVSALVREPAGPTVLVAGSSQAARRFVGGHRVVEVVAPAAGVETRMGEWAGQLAAHRVAADEPDVREVASFHLAPASIRAAARHAADLAALGRRCDVELLREAARAQSHLELGDLARKIESGRGWQDLVLPPPALAHLMEIASGIRAQGRVLDEWGFDRHLPRGKGWNVLFAGPAGTGKTMAAEVLANDLGLDLYAIDLATVVDKYIGETEKRLQRIFDVAAGSNAILLFDEADALFGKRSEVRDARDRYANVEVAYLLQRMEAFDGITILATNLRANLDEAFARRMRAVVEFPFPDESLRRLLWERSFPAGVPLDHAVDLGFLAARFELAGGNISNGALGAASLAAAADRCIHMADLVVAVGREYQKLGKVPGRSEFGPYYDQVLTFLGGAA